MAIKFVDKLDQEMLERIKKLGITEEDLFNSNSDLYIGCKSVWQAQDIIKDQSQALYTTFIPEKDSDMDKYPIAVEIVFGYMDGAFKERYPNHSK